MMDSIKAVIFDMDGTLLDTLGDLADSMNAVLTEMGFPSHTADEYRYFVGNGMKKLAERALPKEFRTEANVENCLEKMKEEYSKHWDVKTSVYEGIPGLLRELVGRGIMVAILSNKPDEFTGLMASSLLGDFSFNRVLGMRPGFPAKPDPTSAVEIAEDLGVDAGSVMFVGDTSVDMNTAVNAGMTAVGVLWGFRDRDELLDAGAKIILNRPEELLEYLPTR